MEKGVIQKINRGKKLKALSVFDEELAEPIINSNPMVDAPIDIRLALTESEKEREVLYEINKKSFSHEPRLSKIEELDLSNNADTSTSNSELKTINLFITKSDKKASTPLTPHVDEPKLNQLNIEKLSAKGHDAKVLVSSNSKMCRQEKSSSELRPEVRFSTLSRIQKNIVLSFYNFCQDSREKFTHEITSAMLSEISKSSINTSQSAVKRLISRELISRKEFKNGPGGWTSYWLADATYNEIYELNTKSSLDLLPKANTTANMVITNLGEAKQNSDAEAVRNFASLPDDWRSIDLSVLEANGYKLYSNVMLGIYRAQKDQNITGDPLNADDVQECINQLVHDLQSKKLTFTSGYSPLSTLIGGLMKKQPYNAKIAGYVSPKILAVTERAARLNQETRQLQNLNDNILNSLFEKWYYEQDKDSLKRKCERYKFCRNDSQLKATVEIDFKEQNYSKIIYNKIDDVKLLSVEFNEEVGELDNQIVHRVPSTYIASHNETRVTFLNNTIHSFSKSLSLKSGLNPDMRSDFENRVYTFKKERKLLVEQDPHLSELYKDVDWDRFDKEATQQLNS